MVLQIAVSWRFTKLVAEKDLMAAPDHGFDLSVRLVRLAPDRGYYFRFVYLGVDGAAYVSPIGNIPPRHGGNRRQGANEIIDAVTEHR